MCGIAGIINADPTKSVDVRQLEAMCAVMRHRGPDEAGIWVHGSIGVGMTRLSIIDLYAGHQPIHNEDNTSCIVFNGEIYNYQELRENLLKRGHVFSTASDTETILHLYEDCGEDCVKYLRGMFAFAIWDSKMKQLFLARDRLGIKPLHYYSDGARFIFGSEIKSILQCKDVPREVHPSGLVDYFFYGYVPDPETLFTHIYKLPPGHSLIYRQGSIKIRQYWNVTYSAHKAHHEEFYIERLMDILSESVKMHLVSDVPLGAFLSGGVDSGIVTALMAKHMASPVKTFCIGFTHQTYDERPYARLIARRYATQHYEDVVTPSAESLILDLARQFDEPFADSSSIATYYVSRLARQHVTVALSGDGGDELFGGYTHYLDGPVTRYTNWIPRSIKKRCFLRLSMMFPEWFPGINTLRHISCDEIERLVRKYSGGLSTIHERIFSPELRNRLSTTDPSLTLIRHLREVRAEDILTRQQYLDLKTYLPGDILTKVDRMTMMVSLEARVPLLDHHIVEWAASIPPELKIRGKTTKYLLKKVAERLLPREVIYRPKHGFAVPINLWIRRDWAQLAHELVLGGKALARGNFNPTFLKRIMAEHQWGRRNHGGTIWALMILELWFRQVIDQIEQPDAFHRRIDCETTGFNPSHASPVYTTQAFPHVGA